MEASQAHSIATCIASWCRDKTSGINQSKLNRMAINLLAVQSTFINLYLCNRAFSLKIKKFAVELLEDSYFAAIEPK